MFDKKTLIGIGIIAAIATVGFIYFKKDLKKVATPQKADAEDIELRQNAMIALNAYLDAKEKGEPERELVKLNSILAEEFKIRVGMDRASGKWVARTLDGKDILMVK